MDIKNQHDNSVIVRMAGFADRGNLWQKPLNYKIIPPYVSSQYRKSILSCFSFLILFYLYNANVYSAQVELIWDSNSEKDLGGYKIYYKTGIYDKTGNYFDNFSNGNGANESDAPIDVNLLTPTTNDGKIKYTLTGLKEEMIYFITVTAYDIEGNESSYSNNVVYSTLSNGTVWVDFSHKGTEIGILNLPYNTLSNAVKAVKSGGEIRIKTGKTSETITINKKMTLTSSGGTVVIGKQ